MPVLASILLYIMIFLYGIIIGSFLNVCIYRIPEKQSIVPNSHCMSCGHRLHWYDLFPLFSYLFLKGRCRYCGAKISIQYPLVEALNGVLYLIVFMANGFSWDSILYCLMVSALVVLSVIDWRTYEIPVGCNIFIGAVGILMCVLDRAHFLEHLIGAVCVSGVLFLIVLVSGGRAMGGGDVKLMAVAGLVLGWKKIILAFLIGCILGSVIHIVRMKVTKADHVLAMGPYLAAGIFISALWGGYFIDWYFSMLGF